jgi:DNA-directed RNA polymerase subunit F
MMSKEQFEELSAKLDTIIKLLAVNSVDGKELRVQVLTLSSFGFQPKQIADILGKTPNSIRIILHRLRKEMAKEQADDSSDDTKKTDKGETTFE